jgi:hypothetical protein
MGKQWPVLTIRNPWCWAIVHGGKRIENRSWNTNYRGPLWLHAGARSRWDPAGAEFRPLRNAWGRYLLEQAGWPGLPETDIKLGRRTTLMPFGAVAALAEVTGCHHATGCPTSGGEGTPWPMCTPWSARGQFHIELANVRPLADPVPCKGMLGLWRLPEDVEKAVRAQLGEDGNHG